MSLRFLAVVLFGAYGAVSFANAAEPESAAPDFNQHVLPILQKYCNGCHNPDDKEGGLILDSYENLLKGGKRGAAVTSGNSDLSRLTRLLDPAADPRMPPEGNDPPQPAEIAVIKAWINAGAKSPTGKAPDPTILLVPAIKPAGQPRRAITALAFNPAGDALAVGRYGIVELTAVGTRSVAKTLRGIRGQVTDLLFTPDGQQVIAAAGEPGLFGEIAIWNIADEKPLRTLRAYRDSLYALALSHDGKLLAAAGYDHQIKLWNPATGEEVRTLAGHNGAVYSLAFGREGKLLASASADRTVKLWNPASGERVETFGQPIMEQFAVAFAPDGKRVAGAGGDNRIRVWEVSAAAKEGTNPILVARFGHEQPILKLLWSPDGASLLTAAEDRRVKLWRADAVSERLLLEPQPDLVGGAAWSPKSHQVAVGRLDGSLAIYNAADGAVIPAQQPAKPELTAVSPRGAQRGQVIKLKITGKNLAEINAVKPADERFKLTLLGDEAGPTQRWVQVETPANLPRGNYEFTVESAGGVSPRKLALWVDDISQTAHNENDSAPTPVNTLPAAVWGELERPGDADALTFEGQAGQTLVFDLAHRSLGGKGTLLLQLFDSSGKAILLTDESADDGDPLFAAKLPINGRYALRIEDLAKNGGAGYPYRLTIGALPYVTGAFPADIPAVQESRVELSGYNLPGDHAVTVKAGKAGEMALPLDLERYRFRKAPALAVAAQAPTIEHEPNDQPGAATPVTAPGIAVGRIFAADSARAASANGANSTNAASAASTATDVDFYRFAAKKGHTWIIETRAARRGSPVDTALVITRPDGRPVERVLLQAVRDSFINFRPINSSQTGVRLKNWEEMDLNDYIYIGGEVTRQFRMPQGPDSDSIFYEHRDGIRRTYFDTTATSHANYDAAYVVEPHPPGGKPASNGLPVFPLNYQNDDASDRDLKSDSRIFFTVPEDGEYCVAVSDSRGQSGERYAYQLIIREPGLDFRVSASGQNPTVPAGAGRELTFTAERDDEFAGEIKIELRGELPPGYTFSGPTAIEPEQRKAFASIFAAPDAPAPTEANAAKCQLVAVAVINGQSVTKELGPLGKIGLAPKPKLLVSLIPAGDSKTISLTPGRSVTAKLKLERNGFDGAVSLDVLNLPYGVIVDNIGLNAVLILAGETEREIFLTAAPWVAETDRTTYAVARAEGNVTSVPLTLAVRKGEKMAGK